MNEYTAVRILSKSLLVSLNSIDLEVTGDSLAQSAHFQGRKLRPEKSITCLRSHSRAKTRTQTGWLLFQSWWVKGQLQVLGGFGSGGGRETAILQSQKGRQWGPFLGPGKTTGSCLCSPSPFPDQELTQRDRAAFTAALGPSCVFRAFPGPT